METLLEELKALVAKYEGATPVEPEVPATPEVPADELATPVEGV